MINFLGILLANELSQLRANDIFEDTGGHLWWFFDIVLHLGEDGEDLFESILIDGCDLDASLLNSFGLLHIEHEFLLFLIDLIIFSTDIDGDHEFVLNEYKLSIFLTFTISSAIL